MLPMKLRLTLLRLAARWEKALEDNLKDQALGQNIDFAIAQ